MDKEKFNDLIGQIRDNIGEEASALNSESFLGVIGAFGEIYDRLEESNDNIAKLKTTNEELLKTNGKLFQKIGFSNEEPTSSEKIPTQKEKIITLDEIIDEKGGLR